MRPSGILGRSGVAPGLRGVPFILALIAVAVVIFAFGWGSTTATPSSSATWCVQYIVLGTAWNILGGYTGYVNFGITAFFAIGAYSTVALHKLVPTLPLPVMIVVSGVMAGLVGLGTGYLTLRLRGVFFSIATLALAVVVQTLITNWDFVGGARGAYVLRPKVAPLIGGEYVAVPVPAYAGHVRHRAGDGARHRTVLAGLRLCRHPRRRRGGGGLGRADPAS